MRNAVAGGRMRQAAGVAGITLLIIAAALPAGAQTAAAERAQTVAQAWVAGAQGATGDSLWRGVAAADLGLSALPRGTQLDRVETQGPWVAVWMTLPDAFLAELTDLECERIVGEQVERFRDVDGLTAFMIFARPASDPDADYRPLPDFLPRPTGELNKPEPDGRDGSAAGRAGALPTYNPGQPVGALSGKTVFLSPGHGWYYASTLGRWATQRGNWSGLIEDMSNGEAVLNHLARYLHNAGANVWTCRERDFNTNMVIVDNTDGAPGYTTSGTWTTSTGAGTWYGSNYQHSAVSTTETAVATYTPDIPAAGYYAVYVWTPSASNRSTDARVRVRHTGGTTAHVINMQRDGNTWRFLGMYYFAAGRNAASGAVEISNQGTDPTKYVIADAVRFGGGMGDYVDGGMVSGWPRWEESGNYFPVFMGQPGAPYGTVSGMPIYAKWESESWEDSVYFSWHSNATGSHTGHGTQMYVYAPGQPPPGPFSAFGGVVGGDTLATRIFDEVMNDIHVDWDAAWPGNKYSAYFGELNPSNNDEMPACLIEVAYHDSAADQPSLLDPRFRDLVARACYQGIVKWWYYNADGPSATPIPINTLLPEPPTHLAVRQTGPGAVRVSWRPPPYNTGDGLLGDPATGYIVQTSRDGLGFSDGTATTNTYFDFAGLSAGGVYYYRVIATNAGGQSFPTEVGGVKLDAGGVVPVLVVTGFDRLDRDAMLAEDDPYDAQAMLRERLERMNHYGYVRTFADAIGPTGIAFDSCSNEAVRDQDVDLSAYAAVIWQCGEESAELRTFDATEQTRVWAYLSGGGQLFVSGSEIGWDLDQQGHGAAFYNNLLKADFVADDADTYSVAAVAGSLFDGVAPFAFDNGAAIYDVNSPDVITPAGGGAPALSYVGGSGGTAGVVYDGAFRIVHFAFPFEAITEAGRRAEIMFVVLDFFGLEPEEPVLPPADIIVESRDAAGAVTPAPAYVEVGAWANSSIKSAAPGLVGTGSRFITYEVPNSGTENATFVPSVVTPAKYEVFVTWANGANCYDALYTVRHYRGQTQMLVDQIPSGAPEPANYDTWISLGQYWFAAGQSVDGASVNVSEETVSGRPSATWNYRVYTDGLKLAFVAWWPSGDANGDGHVDLDDFAVLPACVTGPDVHYGDPACEAFDLDLDGDVDLFDLAGFQRAFGQ